MQICMKFTSRINIRMESGNAKKKTKGDDGENPAVIHRCNDCKIELIRDQMEFVCPKCGMVEEFIEGSQ